MTDILRPRTFDPPNNHPSAGRLAHVDSLRALAALMVACAHVWERSRLVARPEGDTPLSTWPRYFEFGITGVVVFFAISGFVIYGTLRGPREGAGRRFIISRFFRLFPAYWLSMIAGLVFIWWWQGLPATASMIVANATMLPTLFHQPQIMGLYWTLETEMVFYLACWLIWRAGLLESQALLAVLIVGMSIAWFGVKGGKEIGIVPGDISASWKNLPRHLGIMFWGAYFRVVYDHTDGFREVRNHRRKLYLLGALTLVIIGIGGSRQFRFFVHPASNWFSPYVVGPIFFCIWVGWLRVRNRPLAWLGKISFSIYLFHLIVATPLISSIHARQIAQLRGWPVVCYLIPILLLTIAVSAAAYYAVELPAINLGRRLAGRRATGEGMHAAP